MFILNFTVKIIPINTDPVIIKAIMIPGIKAQANYWLVKVDIWKWKLHHKLYTQSLCHQNKLGLKILSLFLCFQRNVTHVSLIDLCMGNYNVLVYQNWWTKFECLIVKHRITCVKQVMKLYTI